MVMAGGPPLPKPSHYDFDQWCRMYEMAASEKAQVAEAISVAGNAVLRIRQADGSISRQVLSGEDPLKVTLPGNTFEIVHFDLTGPSRLGLQEAVFVFVRAHSSFDVTEGAALFKKLAPLFPGFGVAVEIRNDAWFVYQQRYPFYNPFNEDRSTPSQQEYERSPTMKCTGSVDAPHCETGSL